MMIKHLVNRILYKYSYLMDQKGGISTLDNLVDNFIPYTGSSLSFRTLQLVCNDVKINGRNNILEFGSGISTIFLEALTRGEDNKIFSIENNSEWIKVIKDYIVRNNGDPTKIIFIDSPIVRYREIGYYNINKIRSELEKNLNNENIDIYIVDGPISNEKKKIDRSMCEVFIKEYANKTYSIFIDDTHRKSEYNLSINLEKRFELKRIDYTRFSGSSILFKGNYWNIF